MGHYKGKSQIPQDWVITDNLIEVSKDEYFELLKIEKEITKKTGLEYWNKPVILDKIPENFQRRYIKLKI